MACGRCREQKVTDVTRNKDNEITSVSIAYSSCTKAMMAVCFAGTAFGAYCTVKAFHDGDTCLFGTDKVKQKSGTRIEYIPAPPPKHHHSHHVGDDVKFTMQPVRPDSKTHSITRSHTVSLIPKVVQLFISVCPPWLKYVAIVILATPILMACTIALVHKFCTEANLRDEMKEADRNRIPVCRELLKFTQQLLTAKQQMPMSSASSSPAALGERSSLLPGASLQHADHEAEQQVGGDELTIKIVATDPNQAHRATALQGLSHQHQQNGERWWDNHDFNVQLPPQNLHGTFSNVRSASEPGVFTVELPANLAQLSIDQRFSLACQARDIFDMGTSPPVPICDLTTIRNQFTELQHMQQDITTLQQEFRGLQRANEQLNAIPTGRIRDAYHRIRRALTKYGLAHLAPEVQEMKNHAHTVNFPRAAAQALKSSWEGRLQQMYNVTYKRYIALTLQPEEIINVMQDDMAATEVQTIIDKLRKQHKASDSVAQLPEDARSGKRSAQTSAVSLGTKSHMSLQQGAGHYNAMM